MKKSGLIKLEIIGAPNRQCGDCQVCCRVLGVEELGKPYYTKCEHQCSAGCGIYGEHPESCKTFNCLWKHGIVGGAQDRPDRIGFLFTLCMREDIRMVDVYTAWRNPKLTPVQEVRVWLDHLPEFMQNIGARVICWHEGEIPIPMLNDPKPPYFKNWKEESSIWYFPTRLKAGLLIQVPEEKVPEFLKKQSADNGPLGAIYGKTIYVEDL